MMNYALLKELLKQATDAGGINDDTYTKLIIMECVSICENLGDKGLDGHYCADEILRHFGIEK